MTKSPLATPPRQDRVQKIESDARGQSEDNHKGGANDGMSSASPRDLSGKESGDATFPTKPKKK